MSSKLQEKLQQREYRPVHALYAPIWAYWFWNSIRAGSMMYVYDANPGMPPVRFVQFSKRQTLAQIEPTYVPATFIIHAQQSVDEIALDTFIEEHGDYPVIIKPDIGERGANVSLVTSKEELLEQVYMHPTEDFLVQEFIDYPLELGVMYYRYPDQEKGHISGITIKEFLTVTGDGTSTIHQLIQQDERGRHYLELFAEEQGKDIEQVLAQGEIKQISYIGNHAKGTKFINANHLINDQLTSIFDSIAHSIQGFYYGRFDIKVTSLEDLYAGNNIKILEVNGIQSEPSHIYDPATSLLEGYKELFKHRTTMYKISKQNRSIFKQTVQLDFRSHVRNQIAYIKQKKIYEYSHEPITSLAELMRQLDKNIERQKNTYGNIDLIRAKHILERYEGDDRQDKVSFSAKHYTKYPVSMPGHITDFDLYIIGRDYEQMSEVHDHADNGCIAKVLQGELTEKRYSRDMSGNFDLERVSTVGIDTTSYIRDDIGYHALGTTSKTTRAVSLHIYSPAKYKTNYFPGVDNT